MKIKLKYFLLFVGLLLINALVEAQEIRLGSKVSYEFLKKAEAGFSYQKRFMNDESIAPLSDIVTIDLSYNIFKKVKLGASYRSKIFERDDDDYTDFDIDDNQRFTLDLNYNPEIFEDVKLKCRFRYQNSMFNDDDEEEREEEYLRARLLLERKVTDYVVPYIGYEKFIEIEEKGTSVTRIYLGNESKIVKKLSVETFFIKEKKASKKRSEFMIGLSLKYKI